MCKLVSLDACVRVCVRVWACVVFRVPFVYIYI